MKETFGALFARLRKEKGLTQDEVAKKLNVSPQAVSKWENDLSCPDITLLTEIAEILGISVDELLGNEKKETVYIYSDEPKDINKMILKVKVLTTRGDKVKVNLPMGIVKLMLVSGTCPQINGVDISTYVDFNQIFDLIEQGIVGKIVEVESADGDIVEVYVE